MNRKKLFDRGEDHQHFGLRKLTIGVASVLLGTTFMIYGGHAVQADTTNSPETQPSTTEVESNKNAKQQITAQSEQKSNVDQASQTQKAAAQVKPAAKAVTPAQPTQARQMLPRLIWQKVLLKLLLFQS